MIDDYHRQEVRAVCINEQTVSEALERISPEYPMRLGDVSKREFDNRPHVTASMIGNIEDATGNNLPHQKARHATNWIFWRVSTLFRVSPPTASGD